MVHGVVNENSWFVALRAHRYEPPLLRNGDCRETAVPFLAHEVVLLLGLSVVLHDVVAGRVRDFVLVDEVDVVADRRVHPEHESKHYQI